MTDKEQVRMHITRIASMPLCRLYRERDSGVERGWARLNDCRFQMFRYHWDTYQPCGMSRWDSSSELTGKATGTCMHILLVSEHLQDAADGINDHSVPFIDLDFIDNSVKIWHESNRLTRFEEKNDNGLCRWIVFACTASIGLLD